MSTDTSVEANVTITQPGPLEAAADYRVAAPARWAFRITGKDEHGRECVVALDWRGQWHQLSGPVFKAAHLFRSGERARTSTGAIVTRDDNMLLLSSPPRTRWIGDSPTDVHFIDASEELEVVS